MNAYVNIEPGHTKADARVIMTIIAEAPTLADAVMFARNVLVGAETGGEVTVTSESMSHRAMVQHALRDALSPVRGLIVRGQS